MSWSDQRKLRMSEQIVDAMVAHCVQAFPEEGCGLLIGNPGDATVTRSRRAQNVAHSARVYELSPSDFLHADRAAEAEGLEVIGVYHSHTHTDPFPSPTDIERAVDPNWHYVIVSLRHAVASTRSYRIENGQVEEEIIELISTRE